MPAFAETVNPPVARIIHPPLNEIVAPLEALILVKVDEKFAGKDFSYAIFLDGSFVVARWDPNAFSFSYFPPRMLQPGEHYVEVYMTQDAGVQNELVAEGSFIVAGLVHPTPTASGTVFDLSARVPPPTVPVGPGSAGFFRLNGRASMSALMADINGGGARLRQEPDNTSVFDLNGRGLTGDTAFDFRVYLTTDESRFEQPRNRLSFNVDEEGRYGFAVGDTMPRLGPLTIDGLRLRGIDAWGTLGPIVVTMAQGEARRGTDTLFDSNGVPISLGQGQQKLWVARVGVWEGEPFSLGFNYLSGKEEPSDNPNVGTPGENTVRSADILWRFDGDNGSVRGVVAESSYNFDDSSREDVSAAKARQIEATYAIGLHTVKATWQQVAPGFMSMGLPWIQQDRQGWSIEDRLSFNRGAGWGRAYWEQFENNTDGSLDATTSTTRYGSQLQYRFALNGPTGSLGFDVQNRSNDAGAGATGLVDESGASLNAGLSQTFDFWGARHSLRADWRSSKLTNTANPSSGSRQKGITINLTSYWTSGFQLDTSYSNMTNRYPQLDMSTDLDRYSIRASYTPAGRKMSFWGRLENVRSSGEPSTFDSERKTIELGMRWSLSEDLTLDATMSICDFNDNVNHENDFRDRTYKMILSQTLS